MRLIRTIAFLFPAVLPLLFAAQGQQITVPRIEQMPNEPSPFNIRDWRHVAVRYDSFVYDLQKTGQYLPLVYLKPTGVNYPQNQSFGLHTYVGTNSPLGNEAINVLPSLVSATLSGIDKSNQFGQNWILMSQDFFNKNNGEGIYLNSPGGGSGGDWWYDLMPNVFFYQLYDLYPNIGDANFQFTAVADRFLQSVRTLGGSARPWKKANMDYRAFNFKTQQPNPSGVHEPEAAGAYAWVLYNAYRKTGNPAYLQGAEWSLEFLNEWPTNPSYELQLPYGTYTAARLNAELGTKYDVEKMVNWSFNRGPIRGWGTIVGTWGGFDVSGVVGEANDAGNDYAFQLNGVQQAAMLVPMVRYDKRFARAIGKWMLNLSNATRMFFQGSLPGFLQDPASLAWSNTYDPEHVIGYEALRQKYQNLSPYATGDAVGGGWAGTNLSLYSTSSIGYLGAVAEKTNVDKILRINLLKTDFYHAAAYPTYLYFNPFGQSKTVELAVGSSPVDVYDALSETFLVQNATGTINLTIPANAAIIATLAPAGGVITYDRNKMLINGTVVDYRQSAQPFTYAPRIQALSIAAADVEFGDTTTVYSKTFDQDSNDLTWTWSTTGGSISGTGATVSWQAPNVAGTYTITLIVEDGSGNRDTAVATVNAVAEINLAPQVPDIEKSAAYVTPGGMLQFTTLATDPNGDPLTYVWSVSGGSLAGIGSMVSWTAPPAEGIYPVQVVVTDDGGLSTQATTTVLVKNFTTVPGTLIAWYPFTGNAQDISGHQLHGQFSGGTLLVPDFWGNPGQAGRFDGVNDNVTVPVDPWLNFQDGITVSCWFKPTLLPEHEVFILSHGSWQNRWKVSITPERRIRWTLNTLVTTSDLDAPVPLAPDSIYQLTATYDGTLMALYLDGQLVSYKPLTGKIRTANLPFLIGQILPGVTDFNFKGVIDEVKIFDYALTPEAAAMLYTNAPTGIQETPAGPANLLIFPNPVVETLRIRVPLHLDDAASLAVFDLHGKLIVEQAVFDTAVKIDLNDWKPGVYMVVFRSADRTATGRFVKMNVP